tara:strand:- start:659 stop:919 length:261 start_codon:yes stop_codon:yes gene_type:complete
MENKYIIIAAVISLIGSFFEPNFKPKENNANKSDIRNEAQLYIDSVRHVNDSLLNALKIENKALLKDNKKYKRKYKRLINGKKLYR